MTRYKQTILEIINQENKHFSADDIYKIIKEEEPKVALGTIYNNLNTLCNEGKIKRIVTDGDVDRYDNMTRHDHLYCTKCGKLLDVKLSDLTNKLENEIGCHIEGYDLKVNIICDECKKITV